MVFDPAHPFIPPDTVTNTLLEADAGVMDTLKLVAAQDVLVLFVPEFYVELTTCTTCPGIATPLPLVFSLMVSTNSVLMSAYQVSAKVSVVQVCVDIPLISSDVDNIIRGTVH